MSVDVEKMNMKNLKPDNTIICNVCRYRSYDLGFEVVPCDRCKYSVHQACYGIEVYPGEKWLCDTCALGIEPDCVLCPIKGGAMKPTQFGNKWSHVSCALWIPEVSIDCVDRMEPIAKLCRIPQSRWDNVCSLCKIKVGACINCSVKKCKTTFHVTCAFKYGLEMRAIIGEPDTEEEVVLKSYCKKHRRAKRHYNKFFP